LLKSQKYTGDALESVDIYLFRILSVLCFYGEANFMLFSGAA